MSTHRDKESTHENIRLEFEYKVSIHRVKESTHEDSEKRFKPSNISVDTLSWRVDTWKQWVIRNKRFDTWFLSVNTCLQWTIWNWSVDTGRQRVVTKERILEVSTYVTTSLKKTLQETWADLKEIISGFRNSNIEKIESNVKTRKLAFQWNLISWPNSKSWRSYD